jgi:hypothetical protein
LPAEQAGKQSAVLAGCIVEQAGKTTRPGSMDSLARAFTALPGKREDSQVAAFVLRIARLSHRDRTAKDALAPLERLLPLAGIQTIIDALKHPGCVGRTRAALIEHLGRRYNRSGRDVWELVEYLENAAPQLDLDSPLPPAKAAPRVQARRSTQ